MKTKKVLVAIVALVLVVACTIGGTLAWLTAQTDAVENTFTVGKIEITLTETFNNEDGDAWVGKIVPGGEEEKDPTVTVLEGSEKCYVYALVDNQMLVDGAVAVTTDIGAEWEVVASSGTKTLYRYNTEVDAADADIECPVFTKLTYSGTLIDETNIAELGAKKITVDAYAHQSENVTQADADKAAKAHFGFSA